MFELDDKVNFSILNIIDDEGALLNLSYSLPLNKKIELPSNVREVSLFESHLGRINAGFVSKKFYVGKKMKLKDKPIEEIIDFTGLSKEEIEEIDKKNQEHPEARLAHKALAREIITDLHGEDSYLEAVKISESLFSGDIKNFTSKDVEVAFKGLDPFVINEDLNIVDLLVNSGICSSKREAREFVSNSSITVNGEKVTDLEFVLTKDQCIDSKYVVVRRGKKRYFVGIYQ